MAKEVEVIFTTDKKGYFQFGQKKKVKVGYAKNYLIPNELAVPVTRANLTMIESISRKAIKHQEELKSEAEKIQKIINKQEIVFTEKAKGTGGLYGSVSPKDVEAYLLRNFEVEVDKSDLGMTHHIKEIGTELVSVYLHPEVEIAIKLIVKSEDGQAEIAMAEKKKADAAKAAKAAEENVEEEGLDEELEELSEADDELEA
ncbi:MAG: large subunit ribosomal protein L9 [Candidatus Marinamargulisbacteria bacterium]|jgi:large subunit ribosomal protein L9